MVVRTPRKPGKPDCFIVEALFCLNFDEIIQLEKVTKHRPKVALPERPRKIHLEFCSMYEVFHLEIVFFSTGKPGILFSKVQTTLNSFPF